MKPSNVNDLKISNGTRIIKGNSPINIKQSKKELNKITNQLESGNISKNSFFDDINDDVNENINNCNTKKYTNYIQNRPLIQKESKENNVKLINDSNNLNKLSNISNYKNNTSSIKNNKNKNHFYEIRFRNAKHLSIPNKTSHIQEKENKLFNNFNIKQKPNYRRYLDKDEKDNKNNNKTAKKNNSFDSLGNKIFINKKLSLPISQTNKIKSNNMQLNNKNKTKIYLNKSLSIESMNNFPKKYNNNTGENTYRMDSISNNYNFLKNNKIQNRNKFLRKSKSIECCSNHLRENKSINSSFNNTTWKIKNNSISNINIHSNNKNKKITLRSKIEAEKYTYYLSKKKIFSQDYELQNKIKKEKEQKEKEDEMLQCTFKPKLYNNKYNKKLKSKKKIPIINKNIYEKQSQWLKVLHKKNETKLKKKLDKEIQDCSFSPQICKSKRNKFINKKIGKNNSNPKNCTKNKNKTIEKEKIPKNYYNKMKIIQKNIGHKNSKNIFNKKTNDYEKKNELLQRAKITFGNYSNEDKVNIQNANIFNNSININCTYNNSINNNFVDYQNNNIINANINSNFINNNIINHQGLDENKKFDIRFNNCNYDFDNCYEDKYINYSNKQDKDEIKTITNPLIKEPTKYNNDVEIKNNNMIVENNFDIKHKNEKNNLEDEEFIKQKKLLMNELHDWENEEESNE